MEKYDDNYKFFNDYKNIVHGMRTRSDCYSIFEKLDLTYEQKNILISIINGKKAEKVYDFSTMNDIITQLNNIKYGEQIYIAINQLMEKTTNIAQIQTFNRIANSKPLKAEYLIGRDIKDNFNVKVKNCPHCNNKCKFPIFTEYVICGFGEKGYDWEGCGKDWCFKCGKILCKSWENNQLFIEENQIHDNSCCKHHANTHNKIYPNDYCQCQNVNVRRNIQFMH